MNISSRFPGSNTNEISLGTYFNQHTNLKITVYRRVEQVTVENAVCDWNTDGLVLVARCLDMIRVLVDVFELLPTIGDCPVKTMHQTNTQEHQ